MIRIGHRICSAFIGCVLLAGCTTVGPDYEPPAAKTPEQWSTGAAATARDSALLNFWWEAFQDPVLSQLVTRAQADNFDVKQALARLREARAQRGIADAALLPSVTAGGSAGRTRTGEDTGAGKTSERYSAAIDASWELDLFGGKRRAVEAADATWQAAGESLSDVRVSLLAEVALRYVEVRSSQQLIAIAEAGLAARSETFDIARWRNEAGLTTQLDVDQARVALEQVRAQIPPLRTSLHQSMHALAVLAGQPPGALNEQLAAPAPVPTAPAAIAIGLPADLLRHRPDVRVAERKLAAQTARIGVAEAERYPSFPLTGSLGVEALSAGDLFSAGNLTAQAAARVAGTIFDGGAIRQNIAVQTARQEEALAFYEAAVLKALREVEDALVAHANGRMRRDALAEAVNAAESAFALARDQYTSGLTGFQTVLDTQQSLLSAQEQLAASEAGITSSLIQLYKALGGGWTPPAPAAEAAGVSAKETTP